MLLKYILYFMCATTRNNNNFNKIVVTYGIK